MTEFSAPMFANAVARVLRRPYALWPEEVAERGSLADLAGAWYQGIMNKMIPNISLLHTVGEWKEVFYLPEERAEREGIRLQADWHDLQVEVRATVWNEHHHGSVTLIRNDQSAGVFGLGVYAKGYATLSCPERDFTPEAAFLRLLNKEMGGTIVAGLRMPHPTMSWKNPADKYLADLIQED